MDKYDDPDYLIVGDRVWVNGIKPGYIQFLGETHFSSGDWAGVVLDEPTGRNDGSINGKHYFYCEPYRGVFVRPYKLMRYPLLDKRSPDSGIFRDSPSPTRYSPILKGSSGRSPSPTRHRELTFNKIDSLDRNLKQMSIRTRSSSEERSYTPISGRTGSSLSGSYHLTKRPAKTYTTVSSTFTGVDGPFKDGPLRVGDKVFVNSSRGVLTGRLRFLGRTGFGAGHWAGIHLDQPDGKNDGSVAGRRYFICPDGYGLFTPSYKVVKANPNRMTTLTRSTRVSPTWIR